MKEKLIETLEKLQKRLEEVSEKLENKRVRIPFIPLLGVLFVILKLCNVISWSWWLVLIPFWGPVVLAVVIVLIALIVLAFIK